MYTLTYHKCLLQLHILLYNLHTLFKSYKYRPLSYIKWHVNQYCFAINPLSANPTKWSKTLKQVVGKLPTNYLSVFDHFVTLAPKGLRTSTILSFTGSLKTLFCLNLYLVLSKNLCLYFKLFREA